ncbi:unnamed protein product [Rotaria sordida]|uniref:NADP-dependent oxidoreductase domain-containing protein n=1 Tax=Rotaria sordida TaxID=392033 RepID=A0A819U6H8_9BILA|nr:unnamed protein product [Rotaria sordida]CAF4092302.1 unnamed protein product [Rotaria sordida]
MGCSRLGKGHFLNDPYLIELSKNYSTTPAQILIRWSMQNGFTTIPKITSGIERLKENMNVFDFALSEENMKDLTDHGKKAPQNTEWNPTRKYSRKIWTYINFHFHQLFRVVLLFSFSLGITR